MSNNGSLAGSIAGSLVWKLCERFGAQVVQLVVSIVIARILEPTEYGSVAMLSVFISLATVFVEAGLGSALIQKVEIDEVDKSSVFIYSMAMALMLYCVLFACSGHIAEFYGMPELEGLLRVLALVLFPGAFNSLQVAMLSKRMEFKVQAKSSLAAVSVAGCAGIAFAAAGFGAWALVVYQIGNRVLVSILLYRHLKWRPSLAFSWSKTKGLFRFGFKILGANLVDSLYHNLESLIIGKKFSAATLAFCDKGKMFPLVLIDNIDGAIQSVMFPSYAQKQGDLSGLKALLLKTISISTYFVFPLMVGLACTAEPVIWLILGEKWMGAVPFMIFYCAICSLFPFQTAGLQALNAIGRSDLYLRVISAKRVVGLGLLIVAAIVFDSPFAILSAALLGEVVGTVASAVPLSTVLGISLFDQLKVCFPNLLIAFMMGGCVYALRLLSLTYPVLLGLQILVGVVVYSALSAVFGNSNFPLVKQLLAKLAHRHQ